jgi:hypothetical protein
MKMFLFQRISSGKELTLLWVSRICVRRLLFQNFRKVKSGFSTRVASTTFCDLIETVIELMRGKRVASSIHCCDNFGPPSNLPEGCSFQPCERNLKKDSLKEAPRQLAKDFCTP